jgi:hypothetical protein
VRGPEEVSVFFGYVLDTTLSGLIGTRGIPPADVSLFEECLESTRNLALSCGKSELPEGQAVAVAAARLLSPEDLVAAWIVQGIAHAEISLQCPACTSVVGGHLTDGGWRFEDPLGNAAGFRSGRRVDGWREVVLDRIAPLTEEHPELAASAALDGHMACPQCGAEVAISRAMARAIRAQSPVSRQGRWLVALSRWL